MKKHLVILAALAALALAGGCIGSGDREAYYQAQLAAIQAQKPLLELEAHEGQMIELRGVKRLVVSAPPSGGGQIQPLKDEWANVAINGVGVLGMAAGIYVAGEAAVSLADTVGKHAGHSLTVSGAGAGGVIGNGVAIPQTATPTVVNPVIVEQPEPVIVNPVVVQTGTGN